METYEACLEMFNMCFISCFANFCSIQVLSRYATNVRHWLWPVKFTLNAPEKALAPEGGVPGARFGHQGTQEMRYSFVR
jgi:hypothetical protein